MAPQPPGTEFLERRRARATAVPPAERSPDVAAFVESTQQLQDGWLPQTASAGCSASWSWWLAARGGKSRC